MMIVGHRGGNERPENTLSAFKHGLELGLQGFEFDIQLTLDGQLVVFHDETLDRTTNAQGTLKEKTLKELKELDAGNGETIPTFSEVLDLLDKKTCFQIEIKADYCEEKLVQEIQSRNLYDVATVISFNHHYLKIVKSLDNEIDVTPIIYAKPLSPLKLIDELNATGISMNEKFIDESIVKQIQGQNKKLTAWTVNNHHRVFQLIKWNVDYICTDFPANYKELLDAAR